LLLPPLAVRVPDNYAPTSKILVPV
jgi:hypothetical protein